MMKGILIVCAATVAMQVQALDTRQVDASDEIKVAYVLQYDASSHASMQRAAADRGMNLAVFGEWVASNVTASVTIEGPDVDGRSWPAKWYNSLLTVFAVDSRGSIVGRDEIAKGISGRAVPLSRILDGGELGRVLESMGRAFPEPTNWHPHPSEWHPEPSAWSPAYSSRELGRIALDAVRQAPGSRDGGEGRAVSLVFVLAPDADRYGAAVTPGVVVFSGELK